MSSHASLDFQYLKAVVSLEHVLETKGMLDRFTTRGDSLVGPCPLHHGDNPNAFVITRHKNLWYCFTRCQRGGDVIDFVRFLDERSYRDTALWLAALAGEGVPHTPATLASFEPFTRRLPLDHDVSFLAEKGIRPDTARLFEAGLYHGRGFLQGCIAVRIHDPYGQPLGYAGRRLQPDQARKYGKWKLPARLPKRTILFNFHRVRGDLEQGCLVIVEDPWSVMRLAQLDIPAVALLGTSLTDPQYTLLAPATRLLLLLDGDDAGAAATRTLRDRFAPHQIRVARLPDGLDPDQLNDLELRRLADPILLMPHRKA